MDNLKLLHEIINQNLLDIFHDKGIYPDDIVTDCYCWIYVWKDNEHSNQIVIDSAFSDNKTTVAYHNNDLNIHIVKSFQSNEKEFLIDLKRNLYAILYSPPFI